MSDITHYRGDTETHTLVIYDRKLKTPFDITGLSILLQIYKQPGDVDDIAVEAQGQIIDSLSGSVKFLLTDEQSRLSGSYWYKVLAVGGGEQETLKYGRWQFV